MAKPFKGVINIDVRDSIPDWTPYEQPRAPEGAPNVLFIVWDDTGFGAWEPFGGPIEMPTPKSPSTCQASPTSTRRKKLWR